jgi:hypothetical protein
MFRKIKKSNTRDKQSFCDQYIMLLGPKMKLYVLRLPTEVSVKI